MLKKCLKDWEYNVLRPVYTRRFEKDVKMAIHRGMDKELLKEVIRKIILEEPLKEAYRDHALAGNYKGRRECHIQPDWLLVYKIEKNDVIFERTGSHSDLFR